MKKPKKMQKNSLLEMPKIHTMHGRDNGIDINSFPSDKKMYTQLNQVSLSM